MEEKILSDEFIGIRMQPDIRKLIEKRASEEGLSISEYIRYAVMFDSVCAGDMSAYKIIGSKFSRGFREWFKAKMEDMKDLNITL